MSAAAFTAILAVVLAAAAMGGQPARAKRKRGALGSPVYETTGVNGNLVIAQNKAAAVLLNSENYAPFVTAVQMPLGQQAEDSYTQVLEVIADAADNQPEVRFGIIDYDLFAQAVEYSYGNVPANNNEAQQAVAMLVYMGRDDRGQLDITEVLLPAGTNYDSAQAALVSLIF